MIVVIPARLQSTRLPRKLLADIHGKSVLQRTFENAQKSQATRIVIATDSEDVLTHAQSFGAEAIMTKATHPSGTDRLGEVAQRLSFSDDDIVVNVQGDEPFLPAKYINECAHALQTSESEVATLASEVADLSETFRGASAVKVVLDKTGHALYFSRAMIPFDRDNGASSADYLHHLGIYAYRAGLLKRYEQLCESPLEQIEKLEQLRLLWHGYQIKVGIVAHLPVKGIDTEADLVQARDYVKSEELTTRQG